MRRSLVELLRNKGQQIRTNQFYLEIEFEIKYKLIEQIDNTKWNNQIETYKYKIY